MTSPTPHTRPHPPPSNLGSSPRPRTIWKADEWADGRLSIVPGFFSGRLSNFLFFRSCCSFFPPISLFSSSPLPPFLSFSSPPPSPIPSPVPCPCPYPSPLPLPLPTILCFPSILSFICIFPLSSFALLIIDPLYPSLH